MMDDKNRVSDLALEKLLLGELSSQEAAEIKRRLGQEPGGLDRLEALEHSNREILEAHPPMQMAGLIQDKWAAQKRIAAAQADVKARRQRGIMALIPTLAVAAGALLFFVPPTSPERGVDGPPPVEGDVEITRTKGLEPKLSLFRKTASGAERLEAGAHTAPGDILQVGYTSAGFPFGAILSIDGRGVVTLHHPTSRDRQPTLTTSGSVSLPRSYELDDAPDFERFFLITSDLPFQLKTVMDAAKRLAAQGEAEGEPLNLPEGIEQKTFTVKKVNR